VLTDDPALTPRGVFRERPFTRLLFDRRARIPENSRVFSTLSAGPVIMIVSEAAARANPSRIETLERRGVTIERWGDETLQTVLKRLGERELLSLLVEGGPTLQQSLIDAGLVDRLQWIETTQTLTTGVRAPTRANLRTEGLPRKTQLGDDALTESDVHGSD
jgi:diaminohydroxyphosphoribosylaminopyrimidine deaminase / 5-amino-6-(5-phosphoribosylamino)uracil reductase